MRKALIAAALLSVGAITSACRPQSASDSSVQLRTIPLTIQSAGKAHRFTVEVAATPQEQERGLMFRQTVGPDAGMIFPMDPARMASFWMKNTVASLDIIFIRPDHTIARIAANAVPYSLDPIDSGEPVSAVLEIAGGRAAELGITDGDRVDWQL